MSRPSSAGRAREHGAFMVESEGPGGGEEEEGGGGGRVDERESRASGSDGPGPLSYSRVAA